MTKTRSAPELDLMRQLEKAKSLTEQYAELLKLRAAVRRENAEAEALEPKKRAKRKRHPRVD